METMNEGEDAIFCEKLINRFIESCSHDFKSPLSSIKGLVDLGQRYTNDQRVSECFGMIRSCTERMQNMLMSLEDILVHSNRDVAIESVDARQLVDGVVKPYTHALSQKGIDITTSIKQEDEWFTDPACTGLIIDKLVSNAVQFYDPGKVKKELNISVEVKPDAVALLVADNGIGIAISEQRKVFDIFHRASLQSTGNGLGLFAVRLMARKLKARLSLNSAEGTGTWVRVFFANYFLSVLATLVSCFIATADAKAQQVETSILAEKTIVGTQYGTALNYRSRSQWKGGVFFQSGVSKEREQVTGKQTFYGVSLSVPLAQSLPVIVSATIRGGVANERFIVLVPGIETEIRADKRVSILIGTSIRMQHVAASLTIRFNLFQRT